MVTFRARVKNLAGALGSAHRMLEGHIRGRVAQNNPNAQLFIYPNAGHAAHFSTRNAS